jgi:hypothetical protein
MKENTNMQIIILNCLQMEMWNLYVGRLYTHLQIVHEILLVSQRLQSMAIKYEVTTNKCTKDNINADM